MTRRVIERRERALWIAGLTGAAAALLLALLGPRAALTGWLAAAVLVQALPTGALVLLLIMRLVRGKWEADLRPPARPMIALVPLAALALLPVIAGMAAIYPWFAAAPESAFAKVWLDPPFFALRTAAWFVLLGFGARRMAGEVSEGFAAGMLIAIVLGACFVATDWLMTLDPKFASSGFGLQVFAFEVCAALAALILLRLAAGPPAHTGVLGGLLLTLLLLWAYFQFMPLLIIWSGNLPEGAAWYLARSSQGWLAALAIAALLGGVPLLALLAPQVRNSPRRLGLCAAAVLAGKGIEFGWLTLPGRGALAVVAWLAALAGLGCLTAAALLRAAEIAEAKS
jgi:hypothetical protein